MVHSLWLLSRTQLRTANGATTAEILEEYEGLTDEDVRACILFATKALQNTDFMPLTVEAA